MLPAYAPALMLLALALSADAFAVALAQGVAAPPNPWRDALRIASAFGAAQAVMPMLGWAAGAAAAGAIEAVDHWVAFVLLAAIGGKMIYEGVRGDPPGEEPDATAAPVAAGRRSAGVARGAQLLSLALATSIDAAAAGFTLPTIGAPLLLSAAAIGATTFALSFAGVYIGRTSGRFLGSGAEIIGGLALIGIGVKTLVEHHAFG